MMQIPQILALSAVLTWLMILTAATLGSKLWTVDGMRWGFGSRGTPIELTPLAGRADRAAKNMLENMILFTALAVAALLSDSTPEARLGANIFFWARVVYWPVYLVGVAYVRTTIWLVSVVGMGLMAVSIL